MSFASNPWLSRSPLEGARLRVQPLPHRGFCWIRISSCPAEPMETMALICRKQFVQEITITVILVKTRKLENTTTAKPKGASPCWPGHSWERLEIINSAKHMYTQLGCSLPHGPDLGTRGGGVWIGGCVGMPTHRRV